MLQAAQYAAEQADVESRVGQLKETLRSASTEAEATSGQLRTMQKGECGLSAMAKRHRAELQQLVQDITRTTQQVRIHGWMRGLGLGLGSVQDITRTTQQVRFTVG